MPKKYEMALYTCSKHGKKKCKTEFPCAYTGPDIGIKPHGCPFRKKSKFERVPITELTL